MKGIVTKGISYAFILLFLYASANKLLDYQKFTVQIGQSPILGDYAGFIAWFIPASEIAIVLLLIFSQTRLAGLYASFGIMAMFTGYIIIILNYAERIPCSCGGILNKMGWHDHLIFNIFFTALGVTGVLLYSYNMPEPAQGNTDILWPKNRDSRKPVTE